MCGRVSVDVTLEVNELQVEGIVYTDRRALARNKHGWTWTSFGVGWGAMTYYFRRFRYFRWLVTVGVCASAVAMISGNLCAVERGVWGFTETGGGVPAPVSPPQPAAKNFNPKVTTIFTDQQTFLDSVLCRSISLESFEDLPPTNRVELSTVTVADFTITTDNPPRLGVWNERYEGAFATDGSQWVAVEENLLVVPQVTTLTFGVSINHFAVNITDYGDFGSGNLEFANDIGDEATAAFSGEPSGNHQFFGIINSARSFRTVTLTHSIGGEFYGIDEIYYCWDGAPDTPISRHSSGRVIPD